MVSDQARALALKILSSYPGWPVSEMSTLAVAEALDQVGEDIMAQVAEEVRKDYQRPPSVAQIFEVARRVRSDVAALEQRYALPAYGEVPMPAEIRERLRALFAEKPAEDIGPSEAEIERRRELARHIEAWHASGGAIPQMVVVHPDDPCDRCDHSAREHGEDWPKCSAEMGRRDGKPDHCLCDGFVVTPAERSA